jgi:uncharacterized protein YciI
MSNDRRTLAQLTAPMLNKKLYAVFSHGRADIDVPAVLPQHLAYMIDLERKGLLFASGPLADGQPGDGLTILRAANLEEARALAEADPFVTLGGRTFEIREWTVMEGRFSLHINYSDRSIEVL